MYPIQLQPSFKDYLWGGERLVADYGKRTNLRPVAESWELSCYPGMESIIENGALAGKSLADALMLHPEWLGARREFPILIKLIDAKQALSLQVHPDDAYAKAQENQNGKNEMWYVVDCGEDTELIVGLKHDMTQEQLKSAIEDDTILAHVNRVRVKPGDCYLIPAGLLHAIGAGALIAEVQQNSDVTYRVYDYGRVGADGKPRPLHIDKAVDAIRTGLQPKNTAGNPLAEHCGYRSKPLCGWDYFSVELLEITDAANLTCGARGFSCALLLDGDAELCWDGGILPLKKGGTAFIPAGLGDYSLRGRCRILLTRA